MRQMTAAELRLAAAFGQRIRERRLELGYTQDKLAMLVGANRRAIGELENGKGKSYLGLALSVADTLGFAQLGDVSVSHKSSRRLPGGEANG